MIPPDSSHFIDIARAFQNAAKVERSLVVEKEQEWPTDSDFFIPFVGWVGENYRGGTVIVAKNPGGVQPQPDQIDSALDGELSRLADADDPATSMRRISALFQQQQGIGMRKILNQVCTGLGETLDDIAYINPCPYRVWVQDNEGSVNFRGALKLVAAPLLKALAPDTIVYLNSIEKIIAPLEKKHTLPQTGTSRHLVWRYILVRNRSDAGGLSEKGLVALSLAAIDNAVRKAHRERLAP